MWLGCTLTISSSNTSFWEDVYTVCKWTRSWRTKTPKCVPLKWNRERNDISQKHLSLSLGSLSLLRMSYTVNSPQKHLYLLGTLPSTFWHAGHLHPSLSPKSIVTRRVTHITPYRIWERVINFQIRGGLLLGLQGKEHLVLQSFEGMRRVPFGATVQPIQCRNGINMK